MAEEWFTKPWAEMTNHILKPVRSVVTYIKAIHWTNRSQNPVGYWENVGDSTTKLQMESSLMGQLGTELSARGHQINSVPDGIELLGHAGAIVVGTDASLEVATDPRSDGAALQLWRE